MKHYAKRFFSKTLPTDYILCYDLDGNANDKSYAANNGVVAGGVSFSSVQDSNGKTLQAATFNNGKIATNSNIETSQYNAISISFWIKTTQTNIGMILESGDNFTTSNSFATIVNNDSSVLNKIIQATSNGGSTYNIKSGNKIVNDNIWHHILLVNVISNDADNEIKIFIDNENLTTNTAFNNNRIIQFSNNKLNIGRRGESLYPFSGSISKLKIYGRELHDYEINALFNE